MRLRMDVNADVGELPEETGVDEALLAVVTSANVACGGHAGDATSMLRVCALASDRGVSIGAQVSYVDRAGFGRVRLDVPPRMLAAQIRTQIEELDAAATEAASRVSYVKPHGALYHAAVDDPAVARAIVDAIEQCDRPLPVLTMSHGELARSASAAGLRAFAEAFADRGYSHDGRLVARDHPRALVVEPEEVRERISRVVREGTLLAVDDSIVRVTPDSMCVHGDTVGAVALALAVRETLLDHGIEPAAFTDPRPAP